MGEHPLAAGKPLAGIAGFKELERKEEILRAIKLHHKLPEGLLGETLKRADQLARQQELEETVEAHEPEGEQAEDKASPASIRPVINSPLGSTLFTILRQFDMAYANFKGRLGELGGISHEEGEALMEEGREIVMAFFGLRANRRGDDLTPAPAN